MHLALLPFGEAALRHFMFLERPEGMDIADADGMAAFAAPRPACSPATSSRAARTSPPWATCTGPSSRVSPTWPRVGEEQLFAGPPQAQATEADFGWPELVAVTDVASAQRAIDEILEQGEGPRGHWKDAHFGQFVEILDEYLELREANPAFDPVRPVIPVNVRPAERDTDVPLVSDPVTSRVMDLFNVSYEILLLMLQRFFARTEETPAQLKALSDGTIALMLGAIKPLGNLVTTLPAGPEYPGRTAGPASSCSTSPTTCCRTARRPGSCSPSGCARPRTSASPAAPATPRSPSAWPPSGPPWPASPTPWPSTCRPATPPNPRPAEDRATLLARAQAFYQTRQALPAPDGSALTELAALLGAAYQAVQAAQTAPRVAARLVNSVLRPLAEALSARRSPQPTKPRPPQPQEPLTTTESHPTLWDLAVTATTLRARLGASAPPGLIEAVAALQDLALQQTQPGDRPARTC